MLWVLRVLAYTEPVYPTEIPITFTAIHLTSHLRRYPVTVAPAGVVMSIIIVSAFRILLLLTVSIDLSHYIDKFLIKTHGKSYASYKQNVSQYFNIRLFSDYKRVAYLYRFEESD